MTDIYKKLKELGLSLPDAAPKGGIYKPVRRLGTAIYVSGQGPTAAGVPVFTGKLGSDLTLEEGQAAAQLCVLNALAALQKELGNLNLITGLIKTLGFVQSAPDFSQQPRVMDGASALLRELWGEAGIGTRSAIGVNELPGNISVEIEFIFEVRESV